MTSEIAILNKEAVALAADSAVTITGEKIFTSANKIFALSKFHPVGIMIYGSAHFMGLPWETLVKIYRRKIDKTKFDSLKEYAVNFIDFLNKEKRFFPEFRQKDNFKKSIYSYFYIIRKQIEDEVEALMMEKEQVSNKNIKDIVSKIITRHHQIWKEAKSLPIFAESDFNDLLKKYGELIEEAQKNVFEQLQISKDLSTLIKDIAINLFTKFHKRIIQPGTSGVVITGFGDKDLFPALQSFVLHGAVNNKIKYKKDREHEITPEQSAAVIPFAESDEVYAFMEGVDRNYEREIEKYLSLLCYQYPHTIIDSIKGINNEEKKSVKKELAQLSKKQQTELIKKLEEYRANRFSNPVIKAVTILPKDELAKMAESLVNLTSFRKRVTIEAETVAGPIDVAVISKGDGHIWIKRKHYFKPELNPQFFANYYRELENGKNQ